MGNNLKVMVCGSMSFAREMVGLKKQLQDLGCDVQLPVDTEAHVDDPALIDELDRDLEHLIENNVMRKCFDVLAESDAIIFLNLPKNEVDGYLGTSSLIEMGIAHYLDKDIYVMYPYPDPHEHRWAHEVAAFQPIVLNGDLSSIGEQRHRPRS